jgi:hypothetical protein
MINAVAGNSGVRNSIIGNAVGLLGGTPIALVLASDTVVDVGAHIPTTGGPVFGNLNFQAPATGVNYFGGNAIAFGWTGSALSLQVDGATVGHIVVGP